MRTFGLPLIKLIPLIAISVVVAVVLIKESPAELTLHTRREPFRAVETAIYETFAEDPDSWERVIAFAPPNDWSVRCDERPFCSVITLGNDSWLLRGYWMAVPQKESDLGLMLEILNHLDGRSDLGDKEEGHFIQGEATSRYVSWTSGEFLGGEPNPDNEVTLPFETYRDSLARLEVLVGEDTGRVYELRFVVDGPNVQREHILRLEYDVDVVIEPPE